MRTKTKVSRAHPFRDRQPHLFRFTVDIPLGDGTVHPEDAWTIEVRAWSLRDAVRVILGRMDVDGLGAWTMPPEDERD